MRVALLDAESGMSVSLLPLKRVLTDEKSVLDNMLAGWHGGCRVEVDDEIFKWSR